LRTIVFLHGTGGNFKGYLWVLAELADSCHAVVIAPSYGTGDWRSADVMTIIQRAMETIDPKIKIVSAEVHVIGLSNGGLGVSQLLRASPGRFRSLVFLSPVFDSRELDRLPQVGLAKLPPILVLSGDRDDRIPPSYVEASVRLIRTSSTSASPTVRFIAGANHFAIFTQRRELIAALSEWLEQQR
jgi:pimeloyl-ACP methyl ester carboxylesterase